MGNKNYMIITHIPFALTEEGMPAVNIPWGWELSAQTILLSYGFEKITVVAPLASSYDKEIFPFTFEKYPGIFFRPLPSFTNVPELLKRLPKITWTLNNEMRKASVLFTSGTPVGFISSTLGNIQRKKRIFSIDGDVVNDFEIKIKNETNPVKKLIYIIISTSYYLLAKYCVYTSKLTFLWGNELFTRYKHQKKTIKIYASWVKKNDIISETQLHEKLNKVFEKPDLKLATASQLTLQKGIIVAIEAVKILKEKGIPVTLDIYGAGPLLNVLRTAVEGYSDCIKLYTVSDNGTQLRPLKPYTLDRWHKLPRGSRLTKMKGASCVSGKQRQS